VGVSWFKKGSGLECAFAFRIEMFVNVYIEERNDVGVSRERNFNVWN